MMAGKRPHFEKLVLRGRLRHEAALGTERSAEC